MLDAWPLYKHAARELSQLQAAGQDHRNELRAAFEIFELTLREYLLPENWPDGPGGNPIEPLPVEAAFIVADMISYIRAGKLPKPISEMIGPGSPGIGPSESRDIGLAVAYRVAVDQGLIDDPSPVATIAHAFGVTRRSVSRWCKNYNVLISDFFPDARDDQERSTCIASAMPEAGLRYRNGGRGADGRASTWDTPR